MPRDGDTTEDTGNYGPGGSAGGVAVADLPELDRRALLEPDPGARARPAPEPAPDVEIVRLAEPSTQTDKWGIPLAVVVIGMFMSVLDTSIVNVAIPAMQKEYGASADDIQWVATAYTLCLGVIVPTSAWLGERIGLRRLYIYSLVGFAFFSALCGTAADLNSMIIWRILQAVPGGVIPVTCLTILYRMVPPQKLGAAMGLYGFGMVIAPGVGPAMGGYLVEYINWRLIYFINVPIGVIGIIAAVAVLPNFAATPGRKFDMPGFLCIGAGMFSLLLAVSEGQQWGWTGYRVLILFAASISLMVLFVIVELQVDEPLLDVRVFLRWTFVNSLILAGVLSLGFFASLYYVPVFLQTAQGITPMNTGLTVLPQAMVMMVIMPYAGRIYDRFGSRWPGIVGVTLAGIGTLLMAGFNADLTRPQLVVWTMIQAAGVAIAFMPVMTAGLSALPGTIVDAGNAYSNLVQRVTGALGVAAFTALSSSETAQLMADRSALLTADGPGMDPRLLAMQQHGPQGLLPVWQQMQVDVLAHTYSDIFLITGVLTLASVLLTFLLPKGRPTGDTGHIAVEMI
ncbi:MAG TPA: DHA2 family efflux MFS transporter permease subunit [Pseudonocardia sp.]